MTSSARAPASASKRPRKAGAAGKASGKATGKSVSKSTGAKASSRRPAGKPGAKVVSKSQTSVAIATELAPAVAIALLEKTEQPPGAAPAALDCLAAGAVPAEEDGKVRVQLMFENGAVLPVEMSHAAGAALVKGLVDELPKT